MAEDNSKKGILKIYSIDQGFCRVNYRYKNDSDQMIYYCIQDEGSYVVRYRCTDTPEIEPSHEVAVIKSCFEVPKGTDELSTKVREFLESK